MCSLVVLALSVPAVVPVATAQSTRAITFDDGKVPSNWLVDPATRLSIARRAGQRGSRALVAEGTAVVLRIPLAVSPAISVSFALRTIRSSQTAQQATVAVVTKDAAGATAVAKSSVIKLQSRFGSYTLKSSIPPGTVGIELQISSGAVPLVFDDLSAPLLNVQGSAATVVSPSSSGAVPASSAPPVTAPPATVAAAAPQAIVSNGIGLKGFSMPSLDDEIATYQRLGWTYDPSALPPDADPHGGFRISLRPDFINEETEGDDIWTSLWMWKRTGKEWFRTRAGEWVALYLSIDATCATPDRNLMTRSYCNDLTNDDGSHLYGWGLVDWYAETGDQAALDQAERFARKARELLWSKYTVGRRMAESGGRESARHLLLVNRLAEVTGKPEWTTERTKFIALWNAAPDWVTNVSVVGGAIYTQSSGAIEKPTLGGPGSAAAGVRGNQSFMIGLIANAFLEAYRTTKDPGLKDKAIKMARYVEKYGMGNCPDGTEHGRYFVGETKAGVPVGEIVCDYVSYSTSMVNLLVFAYKLTGERHFYDKAIVFFNQGTKFVEGSGRRLVANDRVHHFVDTTAGQTPFYGYNNGELQYAYLLFENNGDPIRY